MPRHSPDLAILTIRLLVEQIEDSEGPATLSTGAAPLGGWSIGIDRKCPTYVAREEVFEGMCTCSAIRLRNERAVLWREHGCGPDAEAYRSEQIRKPITYRITRPPSHRQGRRVQMIDPTPGLVGLASARYLGALQSPGKRSTACSRHEAYRLPHPPPEPNALWRFRVITTTRS